MKESAITLLSGGLDSTVATLMAMETVDIKLALTFDYSQRAAKREIETSVLFCKSYNIPHEVIELPWLKKISGPAVWIPNRNAVFVNIAASFAEANNYQAIITGFNAEEAVTFPDNSTEFIKRTNEVLKLSTLNKPKIISPTSEMMKKDIVREGLKLKLNPGLIWSCYEGGEKMCGKCESCTRLIRAFKENGVQL